MGPARKDEDIMIKTGSTRQIPAGHHRRPGKLWQLRLYVAGQTPKSLTALSNLRTICESNLRGRYRIEVIDLIEQPQLSKGDQILAIPTLVRKLPVPMRKIIGDLSDTERVLIGLDLRPPPSGKPIWAGADESPPSQPHNHDF